MSYAVANALFGGSAEYVALSLKSFGVENAFFWYVSGMCLLALLVSLRLHRKGKEIQLKNPGLGRGQRHLTGYG